MIRAIGGQSWRRSWRRPWAWFVYQNLHLASISMVYLAVVIFVASRTGARPALACAAFSLLIYSFLFTEPRFRLHMADQDEILTVLLFLITAHGNRSAGCASAGAARNPQGELCGESRPGTAFRSTGRCGRPT